MGPGSSLLLEAFTTQTASYLDRRWWMRLITLFPCLRILQYLYVGVAAPRLPYPIPRVAQHHGQALSLITSLLDY